MKLTRTAVDRIEPAPGKQKLVWDTEIRGFGIRISPGGAKAYIMQRRVNGTERRVTIGRADVISAEAARKKALSLAAQFLDGKDPVVEKRRQRARSVTLREAFEDYIAAPKKKGGGRGAPKKARTVADIRNVMAYFDGWLDLPASEVTGAMVKKRHAEI
ncbi:MAG: Arm DNA-binding domain-containing protein, partial [Pseudomonadota bacterium]